MNFDNKVISSGQSIFENFPRARLNNEWISNLNIIASVMGIGGVSQETRDLIYADKINSVINLISSLCSASEGIGKIIGYDEEEEPIYSYQPVNYSINGSATKGDIIRASLFDSIRRNYNSLVSWYNWYTG